jgi:hypothetical protein
MGTRFFEGALGRHRGVAFLLNPAGFVDSWFSLFSNGSGVAPLNSAQTQRRFPPPWTVEDIGVA